MRIKALTIVVLAVTVSSAQPPSRKTLRFYTTTTRTDPPRLSKGLEYRPHECRTLDVSEYGVEIGAHESHRDYGKFGHLTIKFYVYDSFHLVLTLADFVRSVRFRE